MKYEFHYRLMKELEVAVDDLGNPAEAFCQVSFESENDLSEEDITRLHEGACRRQVALGDKAMLPFIIPITKEEYEKEGGPE